MEWSQLKKHILEDPLEPLYLVHGDEKQLQRELLEAFRQRVFSSGLGDWNWDVVYADRDLAWERVAESLAGAGFGTGPRVVVVKDCEAAPAEVWNNLTAWLEDHQTGNSLLLFFNHLDGRLKAVKKLKAAAREIECKRYKGDALQRYVTDQAALRNVSMDGRAAKQLIDYTGADLKFVVSELEKLISFVYPRTNISSEDVHAIASSAPGQLEHGAVFRMTEAMASKRCAEAVAILHELLDGGEPPLRLLPLIERELRLLFAAKHRGDRSWSAAAKAMGENSEYPIKKAARFAGRFSEESLLEAFYRVVKSDRELKLGGSGRAVLEELVLWICQQ